MPILPADYWEAVAKHFPAWAQVREEPFPASEVREGYIHSHGIALQAIGKAGNTLLRQHPKDWQEATRRPGNNRLVAEQRQAMGRPRADRRQGLQGHNERDSDNQRHQEGIGVAPRRGAAAGRESAHKRK